MAARFGYKASAEQFGPTELLDLSAHAEAHGFDTVAVSDHFQPWRHHGGHSPAVLPWLGALGERTRVRSGRACSPRRCATSPRSSPRPSRRSPA